MSDRNLRIEVHYDDHGAQQAVQKLDSSLEGVGTTATQASQGGLTKMSGLMKGALVGAAVSAAYAATEFVGDLMSMSEEMVRVADRTGLTTKAVQQLGYMATQSGNSLDQITTAIGQMQNRIASGDKSAVAAVQALGLNLGEIRDLSADEQFYAIGQAVASIEDPMTRTQLAMDLFGRSGAAILPTMLADMEKLRDEAPVMADETVRALEAAGDTLDWLGLKAKVAGAHMLNFFVDVAKNASQWTFIENVKTAFGDIEPVTARYSASMTRARDATFDLGERGAKPLTLAMEDADRISKQLTKSVPHLGRVSGETAAEVWTLEQAFRAIRGSTEPVTLAFTSLDGVLVQVGPKVSETAKQFQFLGWAIDPIVGRALPEMIALLPKVAQEATIATGPTTGFFEGIKRGAAGLVEGLTGGKGLAGFFSNIGYGITQQLGTILTGGMTQLINWGIQAAWEGVKKIGGILGGLFGGGKEWGSVKDARAAFEGQFGGYEGFMQAIGSAFTAGGQSNAAAEAAILAFWNAKDMTSLNATMQVLKDALEGKFAAAPGNGGYIYPQMDETPSFASGGVIDAGRGTLAMLHGREAIVPLDRPGRVGISGGAAPITVTINNPDIDSTVGLDRFTRRLELALDRAARRARAA